MIEQSRINPDNISGDSAGYMDDGLKIAGARRALRAIMNTINKYFPCTAPLGGCQGAPTQNGDQGANILGMPYSPGSFGDTVNEAWAGPHDWFRNLTGSYTADGNSRVFDSVLREKFDTYVANFGLLIPAAPFAVAGLLTTRASSMIYLSGKKQ